MGLVDATEWACVLCGRHIQNEQVEQRICIEFCIKLEHCSVEAIQMIQKATVMDNWWLAASSRHCAHSCITSHTVSFCETSNHPGDSSSLQLRFGTLKLLAFPKTKIILEREEISGHQWDSRKYDGAADGDWENCVRSQGACFEADRGITVLCTVCPVACTFFRKCLYFSYYMAGYLLDRPCILRHNYTAPCSEHLNLPCKYFPVVSLTPFYRWSS